MAIAGRRGEWAGVAIACALGCSVAAMLLGGFAISGAVGIAGSYGGLWAMLAVGLLCAIGLIAAHRHGAESGDPTS